MADEIKIKAILGYMGDVAPAITSIKARGSFIVGDKVTTIDSIDIVKKVKVEKLGV